MDEYVDAWDLTNSGDPPPDFYIPLGNSLQAAVSLTNLPLKSKPAVKIYNGLHMDVEDIQSWKKWYQQIKEGRRTFSFEGDAQEYGFNGPVREAKNPDIPRADRRLDARKEFQSPERAPDSIASPSSWIVGLITILLALGGWLFMRKKAAS